MGVGVLLQGNFHCFRPSGIVAHILKFYCSTFTRRVLPQAVGESLGVHEDISPRVQIVDEPVAPPNIVPFHTALVVGGRVNSWVAHC